MEPPQRTSHNLFEVYLRLRPPPPGAAQTERILSVEEAQDNDSLPSHITLNPPTDRRRAIEKFAFTHVFEEDASQIDVFNSTQVVPMVEGVLSPQGGEGTDAVVATLGVTGSGKTHTILGSRSQRGLTQLALDVLFRSIGSNMIEALSLASAQESLQACDSSESALIPAALFIESMFGDGPRSRAATPMIDGDQSAVKPYNLLLHNIQAQRAPVTPKAPPKHFMSITAASRIRTVAKLNLKGEHSMMSPNPKRNLQRPSVLPQSPDVSDINVACDHSAEYAVVVSMYEVHNDRIYDLLVPPPKTNNIKDHRRRPLLFKSTELSPDRKVVAGLRKVVCTTLRDAIMVLEAGLQERRVAGTGSNSVSSRSHGFFCFEVKKRTRSRRSGPWMGSKLTIVDLAGSERARDAKTQGATLVEAGKINESLMYLGQCLQTQSEVGNTSKPNIVPYRQCKLTELLFSNSFPSSSSAQAQGPRRNPQKGVMIVTADPLGDFNATSQILRYSALAREVTVPRIPSITTTILANAPVMGNPLPPSPVQHHPRPFMPPGSNSYRNYSPPSHADDRATMEIAAMEIARLSDEIDQLREEVDHQTNARVTAEAHLLSMEDRMLELEAVIREDCATEFEARLTLEVARFRASFAQEQERNEEHWDRKVDLLERGLDSDGDVDKENVLVENLEEEVERLRRENAILKRELTGRSPTKRKPLEERGDFSPASSTVASPRQEGSMISLGNKLERMRVSNDGAQRETRTRNGSPKKMRKMPANRWEDEELML